MIWYDIWYDTIWYDIWYDMIWYDMTWYDMIWYDMIWYDMIWYDMIWYDMIWYDMIWYENRRGESHALQCDVNEFPSFLLTFTVQVLVIFVVRNNAHNAVEDLWCSWKSAEGRHTVF